MADSAQNKFKNKDLNHTQIYRGLAGNNSFRKDDSFDLDMSERFPNRAFMQFII